MYYFTRMHALTKKDLPAAGDLFADAFRDDLVWLKIFSGVDRFEARFSAFFRMPAAHCIRYGAAWAPSENLEGIIAWVPDAYADMTFWRILMSGAFMSAVKLGRPVGEKLTPVFNLLPSIRKKYMTGKRFRYVMVFGVRTGLQGKGYGRQLLEALITECDEAGEYLYLETETDKNVRIYEHFGFEVKEQLDLPSIGLPMWSMARAPER